MLTTCHLGPRSTPWRAPWLGLLLALAGAAPACSGNAPTRAAAAAAVEDAPPAAQFTSDGNGFDSSGVGSNGDAAGKSDASPAGDSVYPGTGPDSVAQSDADDPPKGFDSAGFDSGPADADDAGPCEFPAAPGVGQPGAPCTEPADCDSGWCVNGPTGKICTKTCTSCCPAGYACEVTTGSAGGDNAYVCLPKQNALCRPCLADAECAALSAGALCVAYGDTGHFCGGACTSDANCFIGHTCQLVQGSGGSAKQCVKTQGECACSEAAIAAGASTTCQNQSAAGTCKGVRQCKASGLSACSATIPAAESCNGLDDNCDGATDEPGATGCTNYWFDGDGDGAGLPSAATQCACAMPAGATGTANTDCDDSDPTIHAGAAEVCNGKDDDCDGVVDSGAAADLDGDGLADCIDPDSDGDGVDNPADCSPSNAAVHPGAAEVCNGLDDDCDGSTDAAGSGGCSPYFGDADQDGFGFGLVQCLCQPTGVATAKNNQDCDDGNPSVNPGTAEKCGNDKDDDCNGEVDEEGAAGCLTLYFDPDGDGYGNDDKACLCSKQGVYQAEKSGDCAPKNSAISPGATEVCNGVDDNCKGGTDEAGADGCSNYYADGDGDGVGKAGPTQCLCAPAGTFTALVAGDCNDGLAAVKPGATEACDSLDNDCNGKTDEPGATGCKTWYVDKDGDSYGVAGEGSCLCLAYPPYSTQKGGDCNDSNNQVSPQAQELCDGVDNDCDGKTDEEGATGCTNYLLDADGDAYGVSGQSKCLCKSAAPYTAANGGDCNDKSSTVHPAASEACDTVDNNCDGLTDTANATGCSSFFQDGDGDGYGTPYAAPKCLCSPSVPFTTATSGDCNDGDKAVYPGAAEVCNGKDDNCDGSSDPAGSGGCSTYYADGDGDGFGSSNSAQCLCAASSPFTAGKGGDCSDQNAAVHPGATESCNSLDDDCNGKTDESGGSSKYYLDADGDGFGTGNPVTACGPASPYTAGKAGDCNDSDKVVYPGAAEVQCNKKDEDCSGADLCTVCQTTVLESFDNGSNGWTLGTGWTLANWAGKGGGAGLAYGNGVNSYPTAVNASVSSKSLTIPNGTTKLQFFYYYSPDPGENYGLYDILSISFDGQEIVHRYGADAEFHGWVQFTLTGIPQSMWGTSVPFVVSMQTIDGSYNAGPGMAVDAITALCN
ncbi:MAG: putative metal-binding motif-containing protein [Deltaproteobacteria bacterium]|nr:putative metal-binding motif-containing protein [Deltaproteobacteria bacterium]